MSLNEMTSHDIYQACQKIVFEAGAILETEKKREYKIIRKSRKELVTEIDLIIQNYLSESLGAINDCEIFYEEDKTQGSEIPLKECFIIDPIDATHNLVAGLPFYNLSIGYVKDSVQIFGIIYFPYSKDIYHAYRGEGAYKNLDQIHVSKNTVLEKSIIAYDNQFHLDQSIMINYQKLVESVFTTRILGSANRDACFIAEGILDARVWNLTKVYDIVAGSIIVSEAGGSVTDFNSQPINLSNINGVVMSNGGIHQELIELID
jgi:myo-inositol-1(or 4)-monophosphatase